MLTTDKPNSLDLEGVETPRDVYKRQLQYDDSKGILRKIVDEPENLDSFTQRSSSVERICSAYYDILGFLRENFSASPRKLKHFYATFTKRVKLIRIITPSLTNALKVFETINDRGVGPVSYTHLDVYKRQAQPTARSYA